jgi:hypothetical protein
MFKISWECNTNGEMLIWNRQIKIPRRKWVDNARKTGGGDMNCVELVEDAVQW